MTTPDVTVLGHPLAGDLLATLRTAGSGAGAFRGAALRLGVLLVAEATSGLRVRAAEVTTPVGQAEVHVVEQRVVGLPVLRAGLGLVPALTFLLPDAAVGAIGLERDETTHRPVEYYRRIPDATHALGLVLEPMLATGGSASHAVAALRAAGATEVAVVTVVSAPDGLERVAADHPGVRVITASVDEGLNADAFIVPGLGDFGDRLFST